MTDTLNISRIFLVTGREREPAGVPCGGARGPERHPAAPAAPLGREGEHEGRPDPVRLRRPERRAAGSHSVQPQVRPQGRDLDLEDHARRRPAGHGLHDGHERPLRQGHAAAGQEEQADDEHQAAQSQSSLERNLRLRRSVNLFFTAFISQYVSS